MHRRTPSSQARGLDLPETVRVRRAPGLPPDLPSAAWRCDPDIRPAAFNPSPPCRCPAPAADPEDRGTQPLRPALRPGCQREATDAAMIAIGVAAPCHPNAVSPITHSGMTIAARTDAVGLMTLDLPALESPAYRHGDPAGWQARDVTVPVSRTSPITTVSRWRGGRSRRRTARHGRRRGLDVGWPCPSSATARPRVAATGWVHDASRR
jgi:hypothetical protein